MFQTLRGPHDKPHKLNGGWGRLREEPTGLNRLAQTSTFFPSSFYITPNMEKDTRLQSVPEEIQFSSSSSGRWEPDEVMFSFFPGQSQNGKSVSWKQHEWSSSHLEVEKNQDPEKPSYMSWGRSRARLEPSLSSPRPTPFLLYSAAFHCPVDNQN